MNTARIFAVSIGITKYARLKTLQSAARDARDIAEALRGAAVPAQVELLLDTEATKEAILNRLAWLASQAGPDDTAVVFFSGHGGRQTAAANAQAYLCPVNAVLSSAAETCITSEELTTALRAITSGRLVVLLDACHSGGIGEPRGHRGGLAVGLTSKDIADLIEGRGRVIMAASRPDELAWELGEMQNGLFTHYLLRGLRGEVVRGDGTVWVSELFGYVSRGVRQHYRQHPYQKSIGEDFVVLVQSTLVNRTERLPSPAATQIEQRRLRLALRSAYNRAELAVLCRDLGLNLEDLPGMTLETQLMDLIDHCHRHGLYAQLIERVQADRPHLAINH